MWPTHTTLTTPDIYDQQLADMLEPISTKLFYRAKQVFSRPGQQMDFIYFIKEGRTKHYMDNCDGGIKILYTLTPGWFLVRRPGC